MRPQDLDAVGGLKAVVAHPAPEVGHPAHRVPFERLARNVEAPFLQFVQELPDVREQDLAHLACRPAQHQVNHDDGPELEDRFPLAAILRLGHLYPLLPDLVRQAEARCVTAFAPQAQVNVDVIVRACLAPEPVFGLQGALVKRVLPVQVDQAADYFRIHVEGVEGQRRHRGEITQEQHRVTPGHVPKHVGHVR